MNRRRKTFIVGRPLAVIGALMLAFVARACRISAAQAAEHEPLQVSLSVEQQTVAVPLPARVVLRFHNSGSQTLWLYEPLSDAASMSSSSGGSSVAVHLEPASSQRSAASGTEIPAVGTLFRFPGFPHPQLAALTPGADRELHATIEIQPASLGSGGKNAPVWGEYRLSLVYSAGYPDKNAIASATGVSVWTGSVLTNAVSITVQPPAAAEQGSIAGRVSDRDGRLDPGVLVSLADDQEHPVAQTLTDSSGGFRFGGLAFGRYWVTVRWPGVDHDTGFFEHADVSASEPDVRMKLIMLNPETYEAKQMLHKPVLIRVTASSGNAVAGATLKILWSDGSVTESEKAETDPTGLALINLIPGTNYVTVTKHGCRKEDRMASVEPGRGIDGIGITYDCKR